jgi:hypothetical protein
MRTTLCLFVLLSFAGMFCSKKQATINTAETPERPIEQSSVTYVIRKGMHYSDQSDPEILKTANISAHVTFNNSAVYTSIDPVNQADVNKLIGFSDCGTDHQQNSARLGWSWNGKDLMIYAYAYVNQLRVIKTMGAVKLNEPFACSVKAVNKYYYFRVNEVTDSIPRYCTSDSAFRYKLFPYFGGDETAPHEISIHIEEGFNTGTR